ncbi:hypothetical protein [Cyclobacterium amurskyense]|jgi:hypothetical protein|uniref:hypothetical protein n=1 Tax=Cyclobacterium amurskyense TaxID=320787 RepID=UPI0030DA4182|tara:strand:- start:2472 stop:2837 length:366 start_codon:yes stop_codon:yes gene_type:complete
MKKTLSILSLVFIMSSCALIQPRIPYQLGMSESKFLRQNKDAVISQISVDKKVYRVNNGDRFYLLVTFENDALTNLEEMELTPQWPAQRYMDENNPNYNNPNYNNPNGNQNRYPQQNNPNQ